MEAHHVLYCSCDAAREASPTTAPGSGGDRRRRLPLPPLDRHAGNPRRAGPVVDLGAVPGRGATRTSDAASISATGRTVSWSTRPRGCRGSCGSAPRSSGWRRSPPWPDSPSPSCAGTRRGHRPRGSNGCSSWSSLPAPSLAVAGRGFDLTLSTVAVLGFFAFHRAGPAGAPLGRHPRGDLEPRGVRLAGQVQQRPLLRGPARVRHGGRGPQAQGGLIDAAPPRFGPRWCWRPSPAPRACCGRSPVTP